MIHVGLNLITLPPDVAGGAERYAKALFEGIAGRDDPNLTATLLTNDLAMDRYRAALEPADRVLALPVARIGRSRSSRVRTLARAALQPSVFAREFPPDLTILHHPVGLTWPRSQHPTIVTLHDVQHLDMPELFSRQTRAYRAVAYDRGARKADLVLTPTETSRERIIERLDISPSRIRAYGGAFDPRPFNVRTGADETVRQRLDLPERYLLYSANFWPHKNHAVLPAVLRRLPRDVHLLLTGQTYGQLEALHGAAASLGVADRVRHLGFVSDADLPAVVRAATVVVFPSLYEGFGVPPLEGMAGGVPVACSDLPVFREILGDAAMRFDPKSPDSIASVVSALLDDSPQRRRLVQQGLQRAREFDSRKVIDVHARAYYDVAQRTFP